jgi:hypothetical protein
MESYWCLKNSIIKNEENPGKYIRFFINNNHREINMKLLLKYAICALIIIVFIGGCVSQKAAYDVSKDATNLKVGDTATDGTLKFTLINVSYDKKFELLNGESYPLKPDHRTIEYQYTIEGDLTKIALNKDVSLRDKDNSSFLQLKITQGCDPQNWIKKCYLIEMYDIPRNVTGLHLIVEFPNGKNAIYNL